MKEPDVPELENEEEADEIEPKKKRKARSLATRKAKADANAPGVTRIPLIGLTENQLTSADKQDWLSYYKDAEQRVKEQGFPASLESELISVEIYLKNHLKANWRSKNFCRLLFYSKFFKWSSADGNHLL